MNALSLENPIILLYFIGGGFLLLSVLFILFAIERNEKVKTLTTALTKLMDSFNELDEQAKLIVKTDLELNKAQEELDKRLNGLDALQKTSRLVSTTLDESEIFQRLNQPLLGELGFEKLLIMTYDEDDSLINRVNRGFSDMETKNIIDQFTADTPLLATLRRGETYSSIHAPKDVKEDVTKIFGVKYFILTPILAQKNMLGLLFAGNLSDAYVITAGDEELISILADQIGQAVENARLFEKAYRSSQVLEQKVHERTKELATALGEVQHISKMKSEFISAVSHELRTPLTSIKGYASLLMTGKIGAIPDNVKERLDKINKHSDNLVKLINDLLDMSRIESGRVEMQYTHQSLAKIIENVHDLLTPHLKDKNIIFKAETAPEIPEIQMDATQIERVLINLVSNAVKFTPPAGTITVTARQDGDIVTLSVTDTGIGISEEDIKKLFNEFYRVENEINQNVKGTGLGLALCKKIIEVHKGEIGVTSKPGAGSTFYFRLPLAQTEKRG
ncbi:MAG: GAF domain-containing sensor histidine kinase [Candidatus Omnitrophota bacterium]|nr:GAF domain-containing sensor histidine kinase [Candidatus Omnitrophota bacterium]MDZ4242032.1 GAF domain-containing sensor histidine kinase [Candidatus Omnitrophota bacterium]